MILKIANMGHPVLRQIAAPVSDAERASEGFQTLIDDMIETMHEYDGAGLAAPQVHVSKRLAIFGIDRNPRYPDAESLPLCIAINPLITPLTTQTQGMWEGCLSVPGMRGYVERPSHIRFQATDRDGNTIDMELDGFAAVVTQHECDHLDGKLYIDRLADTKQLAFQKEFERYHLAPVPNGA